MFLKHSLRVLLRLLQQGLVGLVLKFNDKVFAGAKTINQWNPGLKDGIPILMKIKS